MRLSRIDSRTIAIILFVFALSVRLVFVALVSVKPISGGDPWVFEETALNLLQAGIPYSQEGYSPRGPLYSFFIAAVYALGGASHFNLFITQSVLSAIGVVLLFLTLTRLNLMVAVTGGVLAVFHPLILFFNKQVLTESLYTFLLLLMIYLAVRALDGNWKYGIAVGVMMGLASLTRGEGIIISGLVWLGLALYCSVIRTQQVRLLTGVIVAMLIVLTPWLARNYVVLGGWTIATEGGITLYMGHHPDTTGGYFVPPTLADLPSGEYERSVFYYQHAVELISADPLRSISFILRKLANLWKPQGNPVLDISDLIGVPLAVLGWGYALRDRKNWRLYYFLVAPIVSVHLTAIIFVGLSRYRAPFMPFMLAFVAIAIVALSKKFVLRQVASSPVSRVQ